MKPHAPVRARVSDLTLEPLRSVDAHAYWSLYVAGRTDVPTRSVPVHVDRYLALPPEEQRTHLAIRKGGRMIGTVRLLPDAITGFSLDPTYATDARAVILRAVDLLRSRGAGAITASFEEAYAPSFEALGFRRVFARMRMEAPTRRLAPAAGSLKPPEESEVLALARFFREAYEGHLEQSYGMHVGSEEDWRGYITGILRGESGRFMPDASFVALDGAQLTGAILVTEWMESPLVAEIGVAADHRRQGIARALLSAASTRLASVGLGRWALYVTVGNEPAIALYRAFGFDRAGGATITARLEPLRA